MPVSGSGDFGWRGSCNEREHTYNEKESAAMDEMQDPIQRLRSIRQQHRHLDSDTDRLIGAATIEFEWERLEAEIVRLKASLHTHFEHEEHRGYMSPIIDLEPHRRDAVEQLRQSHGPLRHKLDDLLRVTSERSNRVAVRNQLLEFVDLLEEHEAAENRLLDVVLKGQEHDESGAAMTQADDPS